MYDFEKIEEVKKLKAECNQHFKTKLSDQIKLQQWLDSAINQNIGLFTLFDRILIYDSNSLYLFKYTNPLRLKIVWLTEQQWFDILVIIQIIFSSVVSAIQSGSDSTSR